ncbi:MAG: hypothetical protein [Bacteriophage sp.]|nr:MAG: hypothetical protein [Bacteriophage sp.]
MLEQSKFLVSFDCQNEKFCEELITTLVIVEEGQVQDIYHSLEDNQDKAYQEIINQVNAEYGDGGVLQFYSLQGIKDYFEIVHIQTQELTSIGFKTAILDL